MAKAAQPVPEGYHTVTAHLMLDDAAQAMEWYKKAFGATEKGRHLGPDGKIMHAVLSIGNSLVIMNDVMPGQKGPKAYGGSPASLWIYVDNADALFNQAVGAGATVVVPARRSVLGRSRRRRHRCRGLHMVDRDAQRGPHGDRARSARGGVLQADGAARRPLSLRRHRVGNFSSRAVSLSSETVTETCFTSIRSSSM